MLFSPSGIECKICGASATPIQIKDGVHISPSFCSLNKEVDALQKELNDLTSLKDSLSAQIMELASPMLGENILPPRDQLKVAVRYLKAEIKGTSQVVAQLQQVKESIALYRQNQGLSNHSFEHGFVVVSH